MRTLAIDYGTRRIGLALSDADGRFATPIEVLHVSSPEEAVPEILKLIRREDVRRLVVGLPLNMDDSVGKGARDTARFGRRVAGAAGVPLVLVDERLSSFQAEQGLIDRKRGGERLTRQMKKDRLDAIAAAGFLQDYLDGKLAAINRGNL
ncbi:MAG: Holliday junction resolvase RuvX [Tepidisphaeraceae bacterium]|jgi:putative Holliday junction resolvase